jgi:DNA-binding response OmpR family regulator
MNILIVEDNKETLDFLRYSLEKEGFVVDTAPDGKVGSSKARTNNYDIIILDNTLPFKEGREICTEIRSRGSSVPIIMLSALTEVYTKVGLLEEGADDYMTKPFSFEELLARIKALLRRSKKIESETLTVSNLCLNTGSHIVKRGFKTIHLTQKEYILLEYLMRNRGTVISRSEILEHVWDTNADPFTNTVEMHILNLRTKVRQTGRRELIHTISGIGYKLE